MSEAAAYWCEACDVVHRLGRCWVRVISAESSPSDPWWGQLLIVPVPSYLEGPGGPVPIRDVEWVDISTKRIKGGIAGRPLELIDIEQELLSALQGTRLIWGPRESTWTVERVFSDLPVQVFRVFNPFRSRPGASR